MTFQDFLKSQDVNANDGDNTVESFTECTDCNSPTMQKINMFI